MRYSIIVAFNNNYALMSNFLESLLCNVDQAESELILFSDGCKDCETLEYLQKKSEDTPWIKLYLSPSQKGYSIANNIAVSKSSGDVLVFLNSDVLPLPGSVEKLVHEVETSPSVCAAQGLLLFPQNMLVQSTGHLFYDYHNDHIYAGKKRDDHMVLQKGVRQALTTAFCAVHRSVFSKYGGFDESYYNAYEGMELTLKITRDGGTCLYCPECVAYHITGSTRNAIRFDDEMPGRLFWSRWRSSIRSDLAQYLQPQITPAMRDQIYFHVECGNIPGWSALINSIGLSISGEIKIDDRFCKKIDLYHNLPFSAIQYGGPILFTVNDMMSLKGNYNWASVRTNRDDLVLDGHGNAALLTELVGISK